MLDHQQPTVRSGTYIITSQEHQDLVLDAPNKNTDLEERLIGYPKHGGKNQRWELHVGETLEDTLRAISMIKSEMSGKFLRPEQDKEGSSLIPDGGNETSKQQRFLIAVVGQENSNQSGGPRRQSVIMFREGTCLCLRLKENQPRSLVTLERFQGTGDEIWVIEQVCQN